MEKKFLVFVNFELGSFDSLDVSDCPENVDYEEYIENNFDYHIGNKDYIIFDEDPYFFQVNREPNFFQENRINSLSS